MTTKKYLGGREVRARYGNRSMKTMLRWAERGILAAPVKMSAGKWAPLLWDEAELDEYDRRRTIASAERNAQARKRTPARATRATRATTTGTGNDADADADADAA
jgi:hypothetical protein